MAKKKENQTGVSCNKGQLFIDRPQLLSLHSKEYYIQIGAQLLNELHLYAGHQMGFNEEELGMAITEHKEVLVTLEVIKGKTIWMLKMPNQISLKKARGHGYLINGNKRQRLGGRIHRLQNPNILPRGEAARRKKEAEIALQNMPTSSLSMKKKEEKKNIPRARIIFTPMGNKR